MKIKKIISSLFIVCTLSSCIDNPVKILILSGSNNHNWRSTTPLIRDIFISNGNFTVDVTERPDTLNASMLKSYDVILTNWSAWPEKTHLWNDEAKQALIEFINRGGGFVCIHGSSSTHYDWPEYIKITGGRWGENTHHGPIDDFTVQIINREHPITKGLHDFTIRDELWVDIEFNPFAEVLCVAQAEEYKNTHGKLEPVALITRYGKGRGYYLVLGHDTNTMANPDWQVLLIRGTEWAAQRKVRETITPLRLQ